LPGAIVTSTGGLFCTCGGIFCSICKSTYKTPLFMSFTLSPSTVFCLISMSAQNGASQLLREVNLLVGHVM
jgi:hypothetical protein